MMIWKSAILLWLLESCFISPAFAGPATQHLFFPAEKNNIEILPQRFEYQLRNKDEIQIGDILIDANQIDFQIIKNETAGDSKIRFRWPAGLLQSGEISIQDNSGKGIWFQKFNKTQVELVEKTQTEDNLQTSLATYQTSIAVPALLNSIRTLPFFRFCVQHQEPLTKIYLCSKDLYFQRSKNGTVVVPRDRSRPESYVEINGQIVSPQGMVILNAPDQYVSMRALMLSGSSLELNTHMKMVLFKDVTDSADKKEILVRAQGAEPANAKAVEHQLGDLPDEWQTHLDRSRPFIYLKGEGDLPLRQEFLINGKLRTSDIQVEVVSKISEIISSSTYTLLLKPAPGLKLKSADAKTQLEVVVDPATGATYKWTLLGLAKGLSNRRLIKVLSSDQELIAAFDIDRQLPLHLDFHLMAPLLAQVELAYGLTSRLDFVTEGDQQLGSSNSGSNNFSLWEAGLLYRTNMARRGKETAYLIGGIGQAIQFSSQNSSQTSVLLGLRADAEFLSPDIYSEFFSWTLVTLQLPFLSSNSDLKLKLPSFELQTEWRRPLSPDSYWDLGFRAQSLQFDSTVSSLTPTKLYFMIGAGWNF